MACKNQRWVPRGISITVALAVGEATLLGATQVFFLVLIGPSGDAGGQALHIVALGRRHGLLALVESRLWVLQGLLAGGIEHLYPRLAARGVGTIACRIHRT